MDWLRGKDLNLRPLGYEPNELPDCSTPHIYRSVGARQRQILVTRNHVAAPTAAQIANAAATRSVNPTVPESAASTIFEIAFETSASRIAPPATFMVS